MCRGSRKAASVGFASLSSTICERVIIRTGRLSCRGIRGLIGLLRLFVVEVIDVRVGGAGIRALVLIDLWGDVLLVSLVLLLLLDTVLLLRLCGRQLGAAADVRSAPFGAILGMIAAVVLMLLAAQNELQGGAVDVTKLLAAVQTTEREVCGHFKAARVVPATKSGGGVRRLGSEDANAEFFAGDLLLADLALGSGVERHFDNVWRVDHLVVRRCEGALADRASALALVRTGLAALASGCAALGIEKNSIA